MYMYFIYKKNYPSINYVFFSFHLRALRIGSCLLFRKKKSSLPVVCHNSGKPAIDLTKVFKR